MFRWKCECWTEYCSVELQQVSRRFSKYLLIYHFYSDSHYKGLFKFVYITTLRFIRFVFYNHIKVIWRIIIYKSAICGLMGQSWVGWCSLLRCPDQSLPREQLGCNFLFAWDSTLGDWVLILQMLSRLRKPLCPTQSEHAMTLYFPRAALSVLGYLGCANESWWTFAIG